MALPGGFSSCLAAVRHQAARNIDGNDRRSPTGCGSQSFPGRTLVHNGFASVLHQFGGRRACGNCQAIGLTHPADIEQRYLNQTTEDWHACLVTLSATKGLSERCFASLSMTGSRSPAIETLQQDVE
jgi:hypothetical protein